MSEENKTDWNKRELGALWRREGKNQNYLSGFIKVGEFGVEREYKLVIFTNKNKSKNPKAPDFVVYQSEDKNSSIQGSDSIRFESVKAIENGIENDIENDIEIINENDIDEVPEMLR
jgi:hypothetical protein